MRTIFKGFSKENNEWVQGDLVWLGENPSIHIGNLLFKEVHSNTVCQYTKYWDDKNKRVFECDIVSFKKGRNSFVGYVAVQGYAYGVFAKEGNRFVWTPLSACSNVLVLGNVFTDEDKHKEICEEYKARSC